MKRDLATEALICQYKAVAMKDVASNSHKWKAYTKRKRQRVRSGMIADEILNRVHIPY